MYPFIFDTIICTYNGDCLLIPEYPVLVTRPPQTHKFWGYGDNGLINDAFENYAKFSGYNQFQKGLLQLKFLDEQYWRYAMYLKLGLGSFLKCLWSIERSPNTVFLTRILFPFFLPLIGVKKLIVFLFTGKLISIIKTKVDITD